jgi:hypothetical protein
MKNLDRYNRLKHWAYQFDSALQPTGYITPIRTGLYMLGWDEEGTGSLACHLKTPWPGSASGLYRPSDRHLSAKLVSIFADRGCHVFGVTDPSGRIPGFLDRILYFFFQVAPQLYSQG